MAEDTHFQECSHDVVGLYTHKGSMWNTDDRVPQKDIKSPYGGGALTLPGAESQQESPCDSQNRRRPMDMNNSLNILVHTIVQGGPVGPQGKEPLVMLVLDHADPVGRYAVVQKKLLGPAGPKVKEPLVLLVLIHADPAGQRAAIHRTTSLWERLPAQLEPPDGDRLVEVISDKEPTVCQVPGSALDSQLMEGITYTEVLAYGGGG